MRLCDGLGTLWVCWQNPRAENLGFLYFKKLIFDVALIAQHNIPDKKARYSDYYETIL